MRATGTYSVVSCAVVVLWIMSVMILFSKGSSAIRIGIYNTSVSTIFAFGDSIVDPGNNNYLKTVVKSNFPPYGRDFPNHIPTGRFSNGRLITDLMASHAGIKENVPPYSDSSLSIQDLITGVSFASSATGYDPLTAKLTNVIPMLTQLQHFGEYKTRLEQALGKKKTENLINNAIFIISCGSNDFLINYFGTPFRRKHYSIPSYQQFLLQHSQQFIQGLLDQGARKIGIFGMLSIGCLPASITLYSRDHTIFHGRKCVESVQSAARDFNLMLQNNLKSMNHTNGAKIYYLDFYNNFNEVIHGATRFGFDGVDIGCCGTGLIETVFLCNKLSHTCPDASKFVFWDSLHPTQKTYSIIFDNILPTFDLLLKK